MNNTLVHSGILLNQIVAMKGRPLRIDITHDVMTDDLSEDQDASLVFKIQDLIVTDENMSHSTSMSRSPGFSFDAVGPSDVARPLETYFLEGVKARPHVTSVAITGNMVIVGIDNGSPKFLKREAARLTLVIVAMLGMQNKELVVLYDDRHFKLPRLSSWLRRVLNAL